MTYEARVQTAVNWLHEHDMHFVALYFDEPDTTGHKYGPFSPNVAEKVNRFADCDDGYNLIKCFDVNVLVDPSAVE